RAYQPVEAEAITARLRHRQGQHGPALAAMVAAFEGYRADPWPSQSLMRRALELADELGSLDVPTSQALLTALRQPFAVHAVDTARALESAWIASRISESKQCAAAWSVVEPHVPWDLDTLRARRDCYQRTGDAQRWEAARDVERWEACEASKSWLRCF
ncbi:MAG: hypothetical protein ABI193_00095, partial [Minicystis sp.]